MVLRRVLRYTSGHNEEGITRKQKIITYTETFRNFYSLRNIVRMIKSWITRFAVGNIYY
jgi:hypothetical protein